MFSGCFAAHEIHRNTLYTHTQERRLPLASRTQPSAEAFPRSGIFREYQPHGIRSIQKGIDIEAKSGVSTRVESRYGSRKAGWRAVPHSPCLIRVRLARSRGISHEGCPFACSSQIAGTAPPGPLGSQIADRSTFRRSRRRSVYRFLTGHRREITSAAKSSSSCWFHWRSIEYL